MNNQKKRFWLIIPPEKVHQPVIWEMRRKVGIASKIRSYGFMGAFKLIGVELEGPENGIEKAVRWFKRRGVRVDPVELNVLEG